MEGRVMDYHVSLTDPNWTPRYTLTDRLIDFYWSAMSPACLPELLVGTKARRGWNKECRAKWNNAIRPLHETGTLNRKLLGKQRGRQGLSLFTATPWPCGRGQWPSRGYLPTYYHVDCFRNKASHRIGEVYCFDPRAQLTSLKGRNIRLVPEQDALYYSIKRSR